MNCSRLAAVVAAMVVVLCGATPLRAAVDADWTNAGGGVFQTGTNWSTTPAAPTAADDIGRFDMNNADYTVTFNADVTNSIIYVENDTLTFDLTGGYTCYPGNMHVGSANGETAHLTVTNGAAGTDPTGIGYVILGRSDGSVGTVIVDGAGASLDAGWYMTVGHEGTGTLTVKNGGSVNCDGNLAVGGVATGGNGGSGTLNVGVEGSGTVTIAGGCLYVGSINAWGTGVGTVNVGAGGTITGSPRIRDGSTVTINTGGSVKGNTTVETGGTLTLAGGLQDNGDRWQNTNTIDAGGTLQGSGTMNLDSAWDNSWNKLVVNGTISPGSSIGTIEIAGSGFTGVEIRVGSDGGGVSGSGTLELEFEPGDCDKIILTGTSALHNIDLDGMTLSYTTTIGADQSGECDFITAPIVGGGIDNFGLVLPDNMDTLMTGLGYTEGMGSSAGWYTYGVVTDSSNEVLRLTYVPEPTFAVLLLVGLPWVVRRRMRRR